MSWVQQEDFILQIFRAPMKLQLNEHQAGWRLQEHLNKSHMFPVMDWWAAQSSWYSCLSPNDSYDSTHHPLRTWITSASLQLDISTFAYKASASSTLGCIWCEWNWKQREARNKKHHPIFVHFWEGQARLNEWMYRHVDVDWIFGELLLGRFAAVLSDKRR